MSETYAAIREAIDAAQSRKVTAVRVSPAMYEHLHALADQASPELWRQAPFQVPVGLRVIIDYSLNGMVWEEVDP